MSGSLVYRPYLSTVPANASFAIQIDESNARAQYNGQDLVPTGTLTGVTRPVTLRPRRITCQSVTPGLRRRFIVADANVWQLIASDPSAQITAPAASDNFDLTGGTPILWTVIGAVAEKNTKRPRTTDSGLTDGTPAN